MPEERRRSDRFPSQRWATAVLFAPDGGEPMRSAIGLPVRDLSATGARLLLAEGMPAGTEMLLHFGQLAAGEPVIRFGVARHARAKTEGWSELGVEFLPLPERLRAPTGGQSLQGMWTFWLARAERALSVAASRHAG